MRLRGNHSSLQYRNDLAKQLQKPGKKEWIFFYDPTISRITINATNPIRALMGIVRIHARAMLRATPHFTVLAPMIDVHIT